MFAQLVATACGDCSLDLSATACLMISDWSGLRNEDIFFEILFADFTENSCQFRLLKDFSVNICDLVKMMFGASSNERK